MKNARLLIMAMTVLSLALISGAGLAEDNPQLVTPADQIKEVAQVAPAQPKSDATPAIVQPSEPINQAAITAAAKTSEAEIVTPITPELETQWVWGEIISLDPQNKEIAINYFDYETDTEKELKLTIDDRTKYENVNSLNDLKLHDTISVDYVLGSDGKYAVRNISVEKPEESVVPAEKMESKPAVASAVKPIETTP
jgi:hypothetical protein